MLKERIDKYIRKYEAANDFDSPGVGKNWRFGVLTVKVDALAHIIKEIVNWAEKIEDIRVLTKEKQ